MRLLKRHRLVAGLDQQDVATAVGVSCSAVCNWEKGKFIPRPKHLAGLSRVLGIPATKLIQMIVPEDQPGEAR